jgi:hypothetical protein
VSLTPAFAEVLSVASQGVPSTRQDVVREHVALAHEDSGLGDGRRVAMPEVLRRRWGVGCGCRGRGRPRPEDPAGAAAGAGG